MMSENNKIGTYKFVAEPFHVDFTGRLTMGVLGNHLLNCAGFHASDRGFGIATLNEDNYTWSDRKTFADKGGLKGTGCCFGSQIQ